VVPCGSKLDAAVSGSCSHCALLPGSIMLVDLGPVAELTEEEAAHYIGFLRTRLNCGRNSTFSFFSLGLNPLPRMRLAVRGVPKGALRTHSA